MNRWGGKSLKERATLHDMLRGFADIMLECCDHYGIDCTLIQGHRGEEEQNRAFEEGNSELRWPHGKHNRLPSEAMDIMRYHKDVPHIRWDDSVGNAEFVGMMKGVAFMLGLPLRFGHDWKKPKDSPHVEIKEETR